MNTILYGIRRTGQILTSRLFALSVMMLLMCAIIFAIADTTNTVYIKADGENHVLTTSEEDPDALLELCGIKVSQHDVVDFSGFVGNAAEIIVTRAFPVAIRVDNTTHRVMMTEGTVADALAAAGVTVDDNDLISQPLYEFLEGGDRILINRIDYRTMTYDEEVPYETEYRYTPLLRNGRSRLLQQGEVGYKILTYGETTIDGYVEEAQLLGENLVRKPKTQVYLVGADVPVSPLDFGYTIENNAPTQYKKVIENAKATGYHAGGNAWGASGNDLSAGHVAVNPNEIPYNSKLYITSPDGSFVYGYAIASDTGVALMEGLIGVDLFYDTYTESALNGVKYVNIYILE